MINYSTISHILTWSIVGASIYYYIISLTVDDEDEEYEGEEGEGEGEDDKVGVRGAPPSEEEKYIEKYELLLKSIVKEVDLKNLKNNMVFENTPLGNVLMMYDVDRSSFVYYSDNTIPYRYLEIVGRKYVVKFQCPSIFYDMAEELEKAALKIKETKISLPVPSTSKSVFAKFKKYDEKPKEKTQMIIKENANRYSYEGKFANFSFLKKAPKQETTSYAEFKKKCTTNV